MLSHLYVLHNYRNYYFYWMQLNPDSIYTVDQLAEALGLQIDTLRRKASKGEIPSRKIFGRYYFKGRDIIQYIFEKGEEKGSPSDWGE